MKLSKTKFSLYASLGSAKMRRRHSLFTVEGEKAVVDSIGNFDLVALICQEGCENVLAGMLGNGVDTSSVFSVSPDEMRKLSNLSTHSPVMAVFRLPADERLPDIDANGFYLVLDGIQDPGNLGTIVRTCHWFGIFSIFASKDTVDLYNPKTVQACMGSLGKVKVTYCDLPGLFASHPTMPVYGTLLDGKDIYSADLERRGFAVMGNEGKGLSEPVRQCVSNPLLIPPAGPDHSESLNVAVATGIVLSEFSRKSHHSHHEK